MLIDCIKNTQFMIGVIVVERKKGKLVEAMGIEPMSEIHQPASTPCSVSNCYVCDHALTHDCHTRLFLLYTCIGYYKKFEILPCATIVL